MFDEAERRDPNHERTWVALVDGNRQQIDTIRDQAATRGITVTTIIDFVHVIEYVWKAAWTFFYPGDPDAETWVAGHARTILTGRAVDAAATIRRQADAARFRGSERTGADEAITYLTAKAPYLDYATALANGWQIATGIIEGAARFLIKDRMDITGARWTTPGARSRPALARRHRQRRLRRVLAMAPTARTPPQPPRPLPTTRSCSLTLNSLQKSHTQLRIPAPSADGPKIPTGEAPSSYR